MDKAPKVQNVQMTWRPGVGVTVRAVIERHTPEPQPFQPSKMTLRVEFLTQSWPQMSPERIEQWILGMLRIQIG
jgi:hypothetical protein